MLDKRHRIIVFSTPHRLHPRAKTRNRQHHHITDLLRALHSRKIAPGDIPDAIKEFLIIEEIKHRVRPHRRPRKLHHLVVADVQRTHLLPPQRLLRDARDDAAQHGVSRLGLDGPLAQLDAPAVPLRPVLAVGGVDFDPDDESDRLVRHGLRDPVERRAQRMRVDVGVDAAPREEDEVAEEVGLEDGEGEGLVSLQDFREGGVEVAQQV